jgi:hypothetical protein
VRELVPARRGKPVVVFKATRVRASSSTSAPGGGTIIVVLPPVGPTREIEDVDGRGDLQSERPPGFTTRGEPEKREI